MNLGVIGLGSMGKRRIRDLIALGVDRVIGADLNPDRCAEVSQRFGIKTFSRVEPLFDENQLDAVVISTPPDYHAIYGVMAAKADKPFFMEANVVSTGLSELATFCQTKKVLAAPSCTMRFHPSVKRLKQLVEEIAPHNIASFSYISGQYLPDWHPWEDYRHFYVAQKETGACREIVPFELNWLTWLFGDVAAMHTIKAKRTRLEIEIDDLYILGLTFKNGVVGSIEVNVIARVPERNFRAIGEDWHILWNWMDQTVQVFDAVADSWKVYPESTGFKKYNLEEMYYEEIKAFVAAVKGESQYGYTLEEEVKLLEIFNRSEQTAGE